MTSTRELRPLDHWRLVRNKPDELAYFKRVFITKDSMQEKGVYNLAIMHEEDARCCKREAWPETFARLAAGTDWRREEV